MIDSDIEVEQSELPILKSTTFQKLYSKYKALKTIIQNSDTKNPKDVIQQLQNTIMNKKRQSRLQAEFQSQVIADPVQTSTKILQSIKKPSTANLNLAETLQRENQLLKQRLLTACQGNNKDNQKQLFEYRKLAVKAEQLELENNKMKVDYVRCVNELKVLKEQKADEERMKWHKEALSDKNPHLVEFYRKKMDDKDKETKRLSKSLKKFTIMEKRLIVKEKAFEVERSEYLDRILYLSGRLGHTQFES